MAATDLCIIGAGSGGLVLASGAVQMGARVVLIEGAEMGGDCLNHGCVPSKALLAAAKAAQHLRDGGPGVKPVAPEVDFPAVMASVRQSIATIAPHDSQERFERLGVRVIRAYARFTGPDRLEAAGETITARRFVVATGAQAGIPDLPGLDGVPYLTNETLFSLQALPEHLVILGAGPVGVEMAQAFCRLGARVTLVARRQVLGREDAEAAAVVTARLRAEDVTVLEGQGARSVRAVTGGLVLTLSGQEVAGSHLLLAMGRKPALDRLNLSAAGVEVAPDGVRLDDRLRTTNRRIHVIGDAAGRGQFTHLAAYHAGVVLRQAVLGLPAKATAQHPRVTYCDPELAQIGLTEAEARRSHGAGVSVQRIPFAGMDRAITDGATEGFAKLMVVRGRPVGATFVGAHAGELIGLWSLAVNGQVKLSAIAGMIAPYPTLSEISKRAAGTYFSPRLFDSPAIRMLVRTVQRVLP